MPYFCNRYSTPSLRQDTAVAGPSFLAAMKTRADLVITFKIFMGLWDVAPKFLLRPTSRWEPSPELNAVKRRNKLPVSGVTAHFVKIFKKRLDQLWTDLFSHLPVQHPVILKTHFPNSQPPPLSPSFHPLCYPIPCTVYVVLGPL